jgi:hypothetical protein
MAVPVMNVWPVHVRIYHRFVYVKTVVLDACRADVRFARLAIVIE